MSQTLTPVLMYGLIAVACLLPACVVGHRADPRLDPLHWGATALAVLGAGGWALMQLAGTWHSGLGVALWVTVAVTLAVFAMLTWSVRESWRLGILLFPYMAAMGLLALFAPAEVVTDAPLDGWVMVHIAVSVLTYGLVTIAAVAALAAFLQDRALKAKRPTKLTHRLPSVADGDQLTVRLLGWGEGVLGLGLATGMAAEYTASGQLLAFDHKTILSLLAFLLIGALLFVHHKTGMRGRKVARIVLLAYLLLTLGYLGVKVVTGVFLA